MNGLLATAVNAHQAGQWEQARDIYLQILALQPDHADALHLCGLIAFQNGDFAGAGDLINRAIAADPSVALYLENLGRVAMAGNDHAGALAAWQKALELDPQSADIRSDISGALLGLEQGEDAFQQVRNALRIQPDHALALMNKGLALVMLGRVSPAIAALEKASEKQPENAAIWFQIGRLYQQIKDDEMAEVAYRNALKNAPAHFEALNNLGNILHDQMRFEDAIAIYRQAMKINSRQSDLHSNLGVALHESGNAEAAIDCYRTAIDIDPDNAEARRNLGMALLQSGAYAEGWAAYEWRWQTRHFKPVLRSWKQPRWQGEAAADKTILVHCEQGFGDSIQFSRYLPRVADRVGRVIVEAPAELAGLLGRIDGVFRVIVSGAALPDFDAHIPLLSLPYVFATTEQTIPGMVPYLTADAEKAAFWKTRLARRAGEKLIGLAWKGSSAHQRNRMRSPGLAAFAPLFGLAPGYRFISLQKETGIHRPDFTGQSERLEDHTSQLHSFDDTAALIVNLDAVVSPDTAVAHLAGALAAVSCIALPANAEWRWPRDGRTSPWYPGATLFRGEPDGDWASCVAGIKRQLMNLGR
ncbi:MAG: tetratricopeptide repeat protein [Rhodospirillales bacterium]|nr:tetratricopeptide repeat protein [Rhodospirillales bacterium]